MDITTLFKACVKTIRTRNKAFGTIVSSTSSDQHQADKNRILSHRRTGGNTSSEFISRAKEVLGQISRLQDFLLEHRKAYLNFGSHLSDSPRMSDLERDKIDSGAQRIMKTCSNLILDFKRKAALQDGPPQLLEHHDAILELIDSYLKAVCKTYSEQRAIRMKRTLETQKLSRLTSLDGSGTSSGLNSEPIRRSGQRKTSEDGNSSDNGNSVSAVSSSLISGGGDSSSHGGTPVKRTDVSLTDGNESTSLLAQDDDQLSAEELQIFESENEQLYNELNSLNEEVRQIESKVVKIAELQEIFTEKVLEQERDIERIGTTLVGTTENLKDANTHIRKAIESSAGLRLYVLFFLLVLSFTLLFLDWYNP